MADGDAARHVRNISRCADVRISLPLLSLGAAAGSKGSFRYLEKTTTSTIDKCHVPQKTTSTHPLGSVIDRPNKLPTDPKFIICRRYQDLWSGRFAGS